MCVDRAYLMGAMRGADSETTVMSESQHPGTAWDDIESQLTRRVLPLLFAGWLVAYIDRFNVGFAALQLRSDLKLSSTALGLGAGLFFIGYCAFEIPSNLILARVGARTWLARILIVWGFVSIGMSFMRGPSSFYLLRTLLGVAEAGFYPGMAFYLSQWLPSRGRTQFLARLAAASQVAGVVGGPLAGILLSMNGTAGLAGWQWLFIIEGIPAVVLGLIFVWWLPDSPAHAAWLRDSDRNLIKATQEQDSLSGHSSSVLASFKDKTLVVWAAVFFCFNAGLSALVVWLPQIIKNVSGSSSLVIGLYSAIPPLCAAIAMVAWGHHSKRVDERVNHVAIPLFVGGVGVAMLGLTRSLVPSLIAASLGVCATASQPPLFSIVSSVAAGRRRAAGIAFVNAIGGIGSFVGPYAFGFSLDRFGQTGIVFVVFGSVLAVGGALAAFSHRRETSSLHAYAS